MRISLKRILFILSLAALMVVFVFTPALAAVNQIVWKKFFTPDFIESLSMDVDRNGNVIVASDTENFPLRITKSSGGGTELWSRQISASYDAHAYGIAADSDGFIYVVYGTSSGASIGKYGPKGGHHWTKNIEDAFITGVDVGGGGNIFVLGYVVRYAGRVPAGPNASKPAYFMQKYNPKGKIYWTRRFSTSQLTNITEVLDVAVGPGGGVYVTGVERPLDGSDAPWFLVKYGPRGDVSWRRDIRRKESYSAVGANIVVDRRGEVTIALDGDKEAVAVKYTHKGKRLWTRVSSGLRTQGLAVDRDRSIYIIGTRRGKAFARKYEADGDRIWTRYFANGPVFDAATDLDNNLYVFGQRYLDSMPGPFLVKFRR